MTVQDRMNAMFLEWDHSQPPWRLLKYIKPTDFDNPGMMSHALLIFLDNMRWEATRLAGEDVPIVITSDYRAGDDKTHGEQPALGVDIRCKTSRARSFLVRAAHAVGITRVGIYCDDLHIHVDIGDYVKPEHYPSDVMWVRECGK